MLFNEHLCNHIILLQSGDGTWDTVLYTVRGVRGLGIRNIFVSFRLFLHTKPITISTCDVPVITYVPENGISVFTWETVRGWCISKNHIQNTSVVRHEEIIESQGTVRKQPLIQPITFIECPHPQQTRSVVSHWQHVITLFFYLKCV
jgi:hypothetical protein